MKRLFVLSVLLTFYVISVGQAEPVIRWAFDEDSGIIVGDSVGDNDGTLVNGASFDTDAAVGIGSVSLDGINDYVEFPDTSELNPGTDDFSYTFWVKFDSLGRKFILNKRNPGGGEWIAVDVTEAGHFMGSHVIRLNVLDGNGGGVANQSMYGTTSLNTNTWYHVAIVVDRNTSNSKIYINAIDDTSGSVGTFAGNLDIPYVLHLGRWSGGGYYLDGLLDDFRVYDHALSQTEVEALMEARMRADNPTPVNNASSVPLDQVLSWTKGADVKKHRLYLKANDSNLAGVTPVIIPVGTESYDPCGLEATLTTYYWRIDEVDNADVVHQGETWNFVTRNADFRDDFNSGTPPSGWRYMWNKPDGWPLDPNKSSGKICDLSCYADLQSAGASYTPDGDTNTANNPPANALVLDPNGGHPGAAGGAGEQDRYAIAAFTVSFDGYYKISDSLIKGTNGSSTGLHLLVHVDGDTPDVNLVSLQPNIEHSFDAYLGFLQSGQTIYVAVGPDGNASYDTFELDFSIAEYEPVLAARYSDSFAGEAEGWGYAWNEPNGWEPNGTTGTLTTGDLDDVSSHQDMIIVSTKYTPDGDVNFANNSPANALQLYSTGGHPGAAGGSGEPDRYAIATFQVSAAGDYQIGHAWLESVSQYGTGLELVVMVNGVEILTKYVVGTTVERFDCHLGYLSLNDIVQVAVGPDGNAGYDTFTWDFEIALVDPFFTGNIATIDVADFNAVGDGNTDDSNAIYDAIQYATDSGLPTIIEFDGTKTYRIETGTEAADGEKYALNLFCASNIYLKGNGATLNIKPLTKIAYVKSSTDIIVEGFTVEYNPLPYFQATIDDYDTGANTVDVQVAARYPMPTLDDANVSDNSATWDFGRSWGDFREHFFIKTVKEIDAAHTAARIIRVTAQDQSASRVDNVGTDSDGIVIANPGYGQTGGSIFRVYNSSRVNISDILINTSPHFVFHINSCPRPVTFDNVDILVQDANERYVSWRDTFHIKQNGYGVVWEECDLDAWAAYDDTWNLSSIWAQIDSIDGNSLTIDPMETFMQPWAVGDWVTCQNYLTGEIFGSARILSVVDNGSTFDVELDRIISGTDVNDWMFNQEMCNRGSIIRNCRSYNNTAKDSGFSTMRLRTPTLFEDNNFDGVLMAIKPESITGPIPQDIVFRRNTLTAGRTTNELMVVGLDLTGSNRGAAGNIVFEENNFVESYLRINDACDIELINNTFTRSGSNIGLYVYNSGPITFAGNLVNGSLRSYSDWISWDGDTTPATDFNELSNTPPSVHITLPTYWAEFPEPYTASVTVDSNDVDGSISNVKLYINDELVGTDSSAPYAWGSGDSLLENLSKGRYKLTAIATDNNSTTAETTSWFLVFTDWPLDADYNFDGRVDLFDFGILASKWLLPLYGKDMYDLSALADNWLKESYFCNVE